MPEGHTIHRIARDHNRWFAGNRVLIASPQGRFESEANRLSGKTLQRVDAHGKHLFYRLGPKQTSKQQLVHIHLGLYGKFRVHKNPPPEPRGAVRIRLIGNDRTFDLNGPNCCEILSKPGYEKLQERLGEDPLRSDADPERVWNKFQKSRSAIGTMLLNQSVIAGIGNVYRAELLFLLGMHPERQTKSLSKSEFDELWQLTVDLLNVGVKYNRIITVDRKSANKPLSRLKSKERLMCYKKPTCVRCDAAIRKWTLGARTMYACETCQT
ncbi:MAG: DNA-formamidopyrimidine glycosylase family protein [Planctomycetota bacterium]